MCDVPALRFPEFTEEWESVLLEDVAEFQKKRISSDLLNNSNYISTENILQSFGGVQNSISIPANTNVIEYQKGDVLLSNIRPYLKKVWLSDRHGGCSADVFVLRGNQCERRFLYYVIASDRFINFVMSGAKGVKMPRGDKSQMEKFAFFIPTNVEQKKIARFLSMLDERIRLQNKIIEKLETLIKGIIETVISSQKPNTLIKNCLECNSSTLQESQVAETGTFPVYGATGISGYTETADINGESILIIKDGSGVGTVKFVTGEYSYIGTLNSLSAKDGYCLKYIYIALQRFNFEPYKTGMAIPHIYFKDYGKAKIFCPTIKEQFAIAKRISSIEDKVSVEKRILFYYQAQKSYLLSQMLI